MSSLLGFTHGTTLSETAARARLRSMWHAARTSTAQEAGEAVLPPYLSLICATDRRGPAHACPVVQSGLSLWLDGELYTAPRPSVSCSRRESSELQARELLLQFRDDPGLSGLRMLDGDFRAVIYDSERRELHLITDRQGFRSFYVMIHEGELHFAGCVRALAEVQRPNLVLNPAAVNNLLEIGHLIGNESLFEGIELLPEAAHFTWQLDTRRSKLEKYWSWEELLAAPQIQDRREAVPRFGDLLRASVARRVSPRERIGISLSGGLDSRAIFAALPEDVGVIHAVTFGQDGSYEIALARQVARLRSCEHHVVPLDARNWLELREAAVWWTDGQFDMMHMHIITSSLIGYRFFDVNLDGFLGDAFVAGGYLDHPNWNPAQKTLNRGRRFINEGRRLSEVFFARSRAPFADHALVEFGFSLPAAWRRGRGFYGDALRACFPRYFGPIGWNRKRAPGGSSGERLVEAIKRRLQRPKPLLRATNYAEWIGEEPARSYFSALFADASHARRAPGPLGSASELWCDYIEGHRGHARICRQATLAIWLAQVLDPERRPPAFDAESAVSAR